MRELTLSEFGEKFQAKCKIEFYQKFIEESKYQKIFKKIKNQPEMPENVPVAMTTMAHVTLKYADDAAAHSCSMRRTAHEVIKYEYFLQLPEQKEV